MLLREWFSISFVFAQYKIREVWSGKLGGSLWLIRVIKEYYCSVKWRTDSQMHMLVDTALKQVFRLKMALKEVVMS